MRQTKVSTEPETFIKWIIRTQSILISLLKTVSSYMLERLDWKRGGKECVTLNVSLWLLELERAWLPFIGTRPPAPPSNTSPYQWARACPCTSASPLEVVGARVYSALGALPCCSSRCRRQSLTARAVFSPKATVPRKPNTCKGNYAK